MLGGEGVDYRTFRTAGGRCRSMHTGVHEWDGDTPRAAKASAGFLKPPRQTSLGVKNDLFTVLFIDFRSRIQKR
ncbi:hypothetical protein FA15DRAFT_56437 [Coprinopsis marcescibilis]|uniref:Uncharacterized protein n=1 Tax=Coprinopsis marcescibilis TaxID=230819 RepID=A0A5C3KNB7_COPMA|nr:hypothetical protein FA15DRAFT_56437 [Coprinopsis marcescibilis]